MKGETMEKTLDIILEEQRTKILGDVLEIIGGAEWEFSRTKHPNATPDWEFAFRAGMIHAMEVVQSFLDREGE